MHLLYEYSKRFVQPVVEPAEECKRTYWVSLRAVCIGAVVAVFCRYSFAVSCAGTPDSGVLHVPVDCLLQAYRWRN